MPTKIVIFIQIVVLKAKKDKIGKFFRNTDMPCRKKRSYLCNAKQVDDNENIYTKLSAAYGIHAVRLLKRRKRSYGTDDDTENVYNHRRCD